MEKIIEKDIEAILPIYMNDIGNCTVIYTRKDKIILEKVIKTIIKNLCQYYHLDLKASNKTYGDLLSIKKHPPIPLTKEKVLIQVKTRVPIGKHDGAYGYINIDSIDKIKSSKESLKKTIIQLKSGRTIEAHCMKSTILKNINNGRIVQGLIQGKNHFQVKEEENLYLLEDAPATKRDIALVYMKLMEIKNELK